MHDVLFARASSLNHLVDCLVTAVEKAAAKNDCNLMDDQGLLIR